MSSIVVAGDTSGSVTLSAPAVSGSTVLTLPAVSGTVITTATGQTLTSPVITAYKAVADQIEAQIHPTIVTPPLPWVA